MWQELGKRWEGENCYLGTVALRVSGLEGTGQCLSQAGRLQEGPVEKSLGSRMRPLLVKVLFENRDLK